MHPSAREVARISRAMQDRDQALEPQPQRRRIHLEVDGLRLPLSIPPEEERYYRQGRDIIQQAVRHYRRQFPSIADLPEKAYVVMGAIDLGRIYAYQREQIEADDITPRLQQLNQRAEELIRQLEDSPEAQEQ